MDDEVVKEYYRLMDIFLISNYATKWINSKSYNLDALININEYLYHELLRFGLNNVGMLED